MTHTTETQRWGSVLNLAFEDRDVQRVEGEWERDLKGEVTSYHKRKSAGVWTGLATLAVALAVAIGYGYTVMSDEDARLSQLPGLASSLSSLGLRASNLEKRLANWSASQQALAVRIQQVSGVLESGLEATQKHSEKLVAQVRADLQRQLAARTQGLEARLNQVATDQDAEQFKVAQLQEQLLRTRQELVAARESYARELAGLRAEQGQDRLELLSLFNQLKVHEVTFTIPNGQDQMVVEGISFHPTKTDVRRQRFDGWIEFSPGPSALQIRGQGVRQPILFRASPEDRDYQLVVTSINPAGVAGYVLVPSGARRAILASDTRDDTTATIMQPPDSPLP
jgi:hypothetical protein